MTDRRTAGRWVCGVVGVVGLVVAGVSAPMTVDAQVGEDSACVTSAVSGGSYRAVCTFTDYSSGLFDGNVLSLQEILDEVGAIATSPIYIAANGGKGGQGNADNCCGGGSGGAEGFAATYFADSAVYSSTFGDRLYLWLGASGSGQGGGTGASSTVVLTGSGDSVPVPCLTAQDVYSYDINSNETTSTTTNAYSNSGSSCSEQNVLLIAAGGGGGGEGWQGGNEEGGFGGPGGVALGGAFGEAATVGAGGNGGDPEAGATNMFGRGGGVAYPGWGAEGGQSDDGGRPGTDGLGGYGGGSNTVATGYSRDPFVGASTLGVGGTTDKDAAGGGGGGFGGGGSGAYVDGGGPGGGGGGGSFAAYGNRMPDALQGFGKGLSPDGSLLIVVDDVAPPSGADESEELPRTGADSTMWMLIVATLVLGSGIALLGQRRPT